MKILILACLLAAVLASPLVVSQDYVEYLRKVVDWEVANYEENVFKGMTLDEVSAMLGDSEEPTLVSGVAPNVDNVPRSVNWQGANCIHEISNQGNCGSCWAFATASVVSDLCCLQSQDQGRLSSQELISCDRVNNGCNGGLAANALKYVQAKGLVPSKCYPYIARQESCPTKCKDESDWASAHVCKCGTLVDCGTLPKMQQCLTTGPITVRMLVYQDFMNYKSGVYCWSGSGSFLGGHAIRCVGYSDSPIPNLNCANSWGPSWGEKGYFRISTKDGCGIRLTPSDAWAAKDCK